MSFTLHFIEEAEEEYLSCRWRYEQQQKGLGARFEAKIELTLTKIAQNPKAYKYGMGPFREAGVATFPFIIVYEIDEQHKTITVLSVFHTKRNPKNKYKKS
ncbi:type II toxin-antitoxin system RelE/ParE family toxin [Niabella aurantiaca]|uniref:type II toxin-antitoxin system RelE/ParE family toxin n=1 Tax=Niabella aurantiaca TaxID=379900 RepID=UPI000380BFEE|nr:type II toxin-antitoxin system RelE/ParE family toxin [Niabella aurantiaca]